MMIDETLTSRDVTMRVMEVKKGLDSSVLGEQVKAIAEVPQLFEQYPFPMVINPIILKISELFCAGCDFIRLCILQSCTECRSQLPRMTIYDPVIKNLIQLDSAQDPMTRALLLNLLGVLGTIVKGNTSVHHIVKSRLDSPFEVEQNAAISTAYTIARESPSFAVALCPVICDLIDKNTISNDSKFKLIPLCQFAYQDAVFLPKVRQCLMELLEPNRVEMFVSLVCKTLTKMEIYSPISTSHQIEYVLNHLESSSNEELRSSLLSDLISLAAKLPNRWLPSHVSYLFQILCRMFSNETTLESEKEDILNIFCHLTSSVNLNVLFDATKKSGGVCAEEFISQAVGASDSPSRYSLLASVLILACKLSRCGDGGRILSAEFVASMLIVSLAPTSQHGQFFAPSSNWLLSQEGPPLSKLKHLYFELLKFVQTFPSYINVVDLIKLFSAVRMDPDPKVALLCRFLNHLYVPTLIWAPELSTLLKQIKHSCGSSVPLKEDGGDNLLQVCVLLFTVANGYPLTKEQQLELLATLAQAIDGASGSSETKALEPWIVYKLACKASSHNQPRFAADLFEQLADLAVSSKNIYWLRALATFNRAQADLRDAVNDLTATDTWIPKLSHALLTASNVLLDAYNLFLAAGGLAEHSFQAEYVNIWSEFLGYLARLCDDVLLTSASSSICARWKRIREMSNVKSEDNASEKDLLQPMRSLMLLWKKLGRRLSDLVQQCVDADLSTLLHLNALSDLVKAFHQALEWRGNRSLLTDCEIHSGAMDPLNAVYRDSLEVAVATLRSHLASTPITPTLLIESVVQVISLLPCSLPSFFFARKQSTRVNLVLIPSTSGKETHLVSLGTSFVLQVMGVVTQERSRSLQKPLRAVTAAKLIVTLHRKQIGVKDEVLSTKVVPVNGDLLTGEFCLNLPNKPEVCRLSVEVILIDEQRRQWRLGSVAGAVVSLNVRLNEAVGSGNLGCLQKALKDLAQPLTAQIEDVIKNAST